MLPKFIIDTYLPKEINVPFLPLITAGPGDCIFHGQRYALPPAISQNGSYWLWGPRSNSGEVMLIAGLSDEDVQEFYGDVLTLPPFVHPYARESGMNLHLARSPKMSIEKMWEILKQYRY